MADEKNIMVNLLKDKAKENKSLTKKLKKLEEKYVEIHKQQKCLIQDRETFIAFLHLVFPQKHLDELLLPDDQYGLYDIEHIRSFWTLLKSQTDNEGAHIIEIMKDEKKVLYQKISQYEKDLADREEANRKIQELEAQINKFTQELDDVQKLLQDKDNTIKELEHKIQNNSQSSDRVKELEREYSELKASQLMNMFGATGANKSQNNSKNAERQVESLKVQLSEKTNDILRIRDENEQLRLQIEELVEKQQQQDYQQLQNNGNEINNQSLNNVSTLPSANENPFFEQNRFAINRTSSLSQSNSMIEHSLELEDPKYRMMEQTLREKDDEMEKLQIHNQELDMKLQKLLSEFSQFRAKAHLMLTQKEDEIEKLKGRKLQSTTESQQRSPDSSVKNQHQYDLDSGYESSVSTSVRNQASIEKDKIKETLNIDYVKNVFIKYLEYQANSNEKEAMTMEKVLFTVLKASDKDIEVIEKARQKQVGGLWSYFYSASQTTVPRPLQPRFGEHDQQTISKNVTFNSDNAFATGRKNGSIPVNDFIQENGNSNGTKHAHQQNQSFDVTANKNDNKKYFNINFN